MPIYPVVCVANRFKFRIDFSDITRKFSSSNCCFLNLKYSSILQIMRYIFAAIMHSFFFSVFLNLSAATLGLSQIHILQLISFFCRAFTQAYQNITDFALDLVPVFIHKIHPVIPLIFICHIQNIACFPVVYNILVFLRADNKFLR